MKQRISPFVLGALLTSCAAAPPDSVRSSVAPPTPSLATAAPAAPSEAPPTLRLPDSVYPTRYEAELTLDPALDGFRGVVSIHLAARRATRLLWLHAQDLTLRSASFSQGGAAQPVRVVPGSAPFVGFALPAELSPEKGGVLRIEYEAKIDRERPQGVYSVSEGSGADARYVYSLFEPIDARRAFPCFDEPEYKVPWKMAIRVRKEHVAFSNAEAVGETDEGAMKRIDFAETPPLPSYLVAFMAGPFEAIDAGTVGREKRRLRFIVPRGRGAETRYAAQVTPTIVARLEDYFGVAYPYSKLDVAVVPHYEGTMEHPGLVGLGQPLTLIKPGEESLARKQSYVDIASHELAHHWFGDYVTMKWWDDTWLNESFAQWMDAKNTDAVEPSWSYGRARHQRGFAAMSADKLASAKKMRQPVESVEDILNAFDGDLTYNKGSSVISMLEHAVTPPIWQKTVRQYMAKHAWKTTVADDFIAMIAEVAGADAAGAFTSFLNQPGVPLVTVEKVCGAAPPRLRLSQQRFLPRGTTAQGSLWKVPVCVRYGAGAEKGRLCTFLSEASSEVPIPDLKACPEWIVPNEEGLGYYISGYSAEALGNFVRRDKASFTNEERAVLLRDVGFLVSNGSVPLGQALSLVPDAVAAGDKTMLNGVQSIFQNVQSADLSEPLYLAYQRFARKTFAPRARALGFAPKVGEDPGVVEMRSLLLYTGGAIGRDPELLKTGKALADKWLDDPASVPADVVSSALALAARGNDKTFFEKLLARVKTAPDRNAQGRLIRALGQFTDAALAERALGLVLGREIELRDSLSIVISLLYGRATRDLAYAFVKLHFDEMLERSSGFERPSLFMIPEVYCDASHRADAEAFFGPRAKTVDGAVRVLANSLETISLCEASRKASLPDLEAFLKKY